MVKSEIRVMVRKKGENKTNGEAKVKVSLE